MKRIDDIVLGMPVTFLTGYSAVVATIASAFDGIMLPIAAILWTATAVLAIAFKK